MKPLCIFLCSFVLVGSLLAQQAPNNALGFQPAKSFQMGDYDTVNLFNGNLTVALPIGPTYTPGGSLSYGLHLIYNGNAWAIEGETPPEAIPNRFSNAGLGWKLTLGELVAPHDPAILDISNGGNWVYVGADGSEHTFYTTLHMEEDGTQYAGSDSLILNTVVGYTRDGSYLRLRRGARTASLVHPCAPFGFCHDYTVSYSIEAPDGNTHTFEAAVSKQVGIQDTPPTVQEDAKLTYRLVSIVDRFGNYLHVTYPDPLTWVLKDGTPGGGDIRTHTIHFINETFFEFSGQSNAHLFVSSIDLAAFNGQTATYHFNYGDYESISKNCDDKFSGATTKTRFLNSVTQPDSSSFAFTYNKIELDPATGTATCSLNAGHLLKLTLPTGGNIGYTLGQRRFPVYPDELEKGIPGTWRDHSSSVITRTLFDANNTAAGTWTYSADLTDPAFFHHPPNDTTQLEKQGLAITVKDPLQRTTVYYYSVDHFGPGMDQSCYTNAVEELEYAMPFTRTSGTSTADGLLLSNEVYDSPCTLQIPLFGAGCTRTCLDASNAPVQPSRSTYVQYELEAGPAAGDQNRRVRRSRTVFNNDTGCGGACYEETEFGDFDGLGHYRTNTHRSNFPGTVPRITTTHFNARGGTYVPGGGSSPDAYMILPSSPWMPGVYDFQTIAENVQTARSEFCFNGTTGFLERRRTWRTGDRTKDLLATFEQTGGNVTAESYFGGDSQPLSAGFTTCTSDPGNSPTYRLTHHYSAGSVDSTQYAGAGFKSLDLSIDSNTGLASASRDTSGLLTTMYTYDTMQRLIEVRPPGEAWTKYTYTFGTPSSVSIIRRPFGSSSTATAETSNFLYFDAFGRSVLSKEQFPEGWSSTKTDYDALGRAVSTSMPEFRGSSSWENFTPAHSTSTTFDRFDRPLSVTMPDTRATTFAYTGGRVTARTACVSASEPLAPCPAGERAFTTTETVDGHGRLASVTEALGNGLTTTYGYDVGNRLTSVSTNAPEGLQHRTFTYDLAGFLTSEQHPEKGINGYGTVSYPEYDARGHLRHRVNGTAGGAFDTIFLYDASERLTRVKDLDPSTQTRRDLKVFDYATDNSTDNPRLGKLQTATRHNYQPTLGGDITVAETYTYGGPNGRVSARATTIGGALQANTFSLGQAWNDLGNIASITYPTNGALASTPPRTVAYSYTNALLTGINGYVTSMAHLANGLPGHIAHANGENEDWDADPSGMARPATIHVISNLGANKLIGPYSYDSTGNIKQIGDTATTHTNYQYDGAGRLVSSVDFTPPSLSNNQVFTYDSFGNKTSAGTLQPRRFDPNGDGVVSPLDVFYLVNFLFMSGPVPHGAAGLLSGDANNDGAVNPLDIFFLINFLFLGGPLPSSPEQQALPSGELTPVNANVADSITVGTVNATGNRVDVPVYIRDLSGTRLGRDQAAGSKIQSFSIKVAYSPASAVSSVTFTGAGITSNLSPAAAFSPSTTSSISLVDTFQESSNLIPFTLNASAPGDLVAHLVFTLNGSASPGSSIAITLDPSVTVLSDEGGNASESPVNGTLALVDGAINIPLNLTGAPATSAASSPADGGPGSSRFGRNPKPAIFLNDKSLMAATSRFAPRFSSSFTGTTNHDAAFSYDEAGDVLHDDIGRSFTYDALSMTTGATVPLPNNGTRNFSYIYTAGDERIALVEKLSTGATTTNWTLRGLDNHLLRTWTNTSTGGWSWREDEIWRGASLLAYESTNGARHYGLDHLGSPAILTDATGRAIGNVSFDAFGNGGATGAGMLQYTGHERDTANVGPSTGTAVLPDYLHARYYDPARARFLSVDPNVIVNANLRLPQRWNRYAYVGNSPLGRTDVDGREWFAVLEYGGNAALHEAIVWIDMKTGRFGKTYEHPRWGDEYIGSYSGSYGAKRGLSPLRFKFLGNNFNPDKVKDPNPNSEYKNGNLQCTNYSEIKQGESVGYGLWQSLAIKLGLIDPRDALLHPILGDREQDSDYKSVPTVPGLASPTTYTLDMTQPGNDLPGWMQPSDWAYSNAFGTEIVFSQPPM